MSPETVAKWVLSRPFQAKFLESLFDICGKSRTMSNPRKCLRVSEIKRSNAIVEKGINVISNHFIKPFEKDLEQGNLFSLISGVLVNEDIVVSFLSIKEIGKKAMGAVAHL